MTLTPTRAGRARLVITGRDEQNREVRVVRDLVVDADGG